MSKKIDVGGQAVIEGVMMKSPHYYAISVRDPNDKIVTKTWRFRSISEKIKIFKWPILRGIVSLFEMLVVGIKALTFSAETSTGEEEEKLSSWAIFGTIAMSFLLAIGIFKFLPYTITSFGISEENNTILFNLVDGLIRIIFFVLYVWLITVIPGIKDEMIRVFQYHGAEHMSVNAHEKGKKLTVENIKKYTTYHPRCGTSFIVIVLLIMVVMFSFIPSLVSALFPSISALPLLGKKAVMFGIRILFMLPIIGISYEILKLSFKFRKTWVMKAIGYPGKLVQSLTTKKPDSKQIEVAIKSLEAVIAKEKKLSK